ncbi:hypothetical protein AX17_006197 [Amanita inopinata Kibby_2008]|nr:hypothetical protein AX17_006197 [Amanita inopinata Kibby_2008]
MYSSNLKINTSLAVDKSASPSGIPIRDNHRLSPRPALKTPNSSIPRPRIRASSSASTSSLSIVTPVSTSTNASSTSLNFQAPLSSHSSDVRSPTSSNPTSPPSTLSPGKNEYVLAMHDYIPQQQNATCLTFRAGQVIHVLNRDPSGWWDGELEGRRGWFPSNYVNAETGYVSDDSSREARLHRRKEPVGPSGSPSLEVPQTNNAPDLSQQQSIDSYCPALMVQLLSVFTVMQDAVHKRKTAHFLPSAAHIVKHVRGILAATGTEYKSAPILRQHITLAQERKELLQTLSPLIESANKASSALPGREQDATAEHMMRCTVEVINRSRRFLIVGFHCGMELPESPPTVESAIWSAKSVDSHSTKDSLSSIRTAPDDVDRTPTQRGRNGEASRTPGTARAVKSLGDLRAAHRVKYPSKVPSLPKRGAVAPQKQHHHVKPHKPEPLTSSTSSSSLSSQETAPIPSPPPFPCGPASARQVLDVFTYTHDVFLSTIAAFIGHAHAYSQQTHASNKVQLCELGNEIIDLACKLLTLTDAILQQSEIGKNKLDSLKTSQQRLFNVAKSFAEIVQAIASPSPPTMDEEEEKGIMLRLATEACKAGADCLSAARVCLANRNPGQQPFTVKSVRTGEYTKDLGNFGGYTAPLTGIDDAPSMVNEEDLTVQAPLSPVQRSEEVSPSSEGSATSGPTDETAVTSPDEGKAPINIALSDAPIEIDSASPSPVRTDEGTTWESSSQRYSMDRVSEDKSLCGELPPLPIDSVPELPVNSQLWALSHDYAHDDVAYNSEGLLVGATIGALVEKMTPHDSIVDPAFSAVFFLTFRLFSSPVELVQSIIARYDTAPSSNLSQDDVNIWEQRKGLPVRLRVSNFIKMWVEFYWRPGVDDPAVPMLMTFLCKTLSLAFPGTAQRIIELIDLRQSSETVSTINDRIRDPGMLINPPVMPTTNVEIPRPIMTKTLLMSLRKKEWSVISVTDFDAMELARQLTIMECDLYCAIQPEEILETGQQGAKAAVNVKAVTSLSTVITGWIAECILNEADIKKRSLIIKFFIKVADRCTSLSNYSTPRSMLAALDSSTISRLHQTWLGVSQKQKTMLESLRRLADHGRNYHEYRGKLRNTAPPAVPFLGLYLTDLTFCREGNPSHRVSPPNSNKTLLNFNKYHKLARIVQDMQRFQVPYNLKAIPEVQEYLNVCFENSRHHGDLQDLYRRSLLVEPKQPADSLPLGDMRQLFSWATRSQSQTAS